MKKYIAILLMFCVFPLAAAEDKKGDVSGRDLEPVLRGFYIGMEAGTVSFIGAAGDHSDTFGAVSDLQLGYDFQLSDSMCLGAAFAVGILQINATKTQKYEPDSPWTADYAPVLLGGDITVDYLFTERFELGLNISIDYMMASEACEDGKKCYLNDDPSDGFLTFGGGFKAEYYTYARHFSIGLGIEYFYILNFDGMDIQPKAFLKYTF